MFRKTLVSDSIAKLASLLGTTHGKQGGVVFLTARRHSYTVRSLIDGAESGSIGVVDYFRLAFAQRIRARAVVICDTERFLASFENRVARVVREWAALPNPPIILNGSPGPMRRYQLGRTLFKSGINKGDVFRLDDPETVDRIKFPCFIRNEAGHILDSSVPRLIQSRDEFRAKLNAIMERGGTLYGRLAIEYLDLRDADGLYCKLSYHRVGAQIIPAHCFWSRKWFVKKPSKRLLKERPELIDREREIVEAGQHEEQVRQVFDMAGIDYGRIDFCSTADGGIHVFEINTNPNHPSADTSLPARRYLILSVQDKIRKALAELVSGRSCAVLNWPKDELRNRWTNQI